QYGHREVIEYFLAHRDEYDQMILTAHLSNQAHIFPLFYGEFPPERYQQDGLKALRHDEKIQVGWVNELDRFDQYPRLLFAVTDERLHPLPPYEVKDEIFAPDGSRAFVLVALSPGDQFVRSWMVAGPFAGDDTGPPPITDPDEPAPTGEGWHPLKSGESAVDL